MTLLPSTRGRGSRPSLGVLSIVLLVALVGGALWGLRHTTRQADSERRISLASAVAAADAVIVVEGVHIVDARVSASGMGYVLADLEVVEILAHARVASQAVGEPSYPAPTPISSGVVRVYEPTGYMAVDQGESRLLQWTQGGARGERLVMILGYWAPEIYDDWPSVWGVVGAAVLLPEDGLDFLAGESSEAVYSDLVAARGGLLDERATDLEVLVAWIEEVSDARPSESGGPIQRAYEDSFERSPVSDWLDLPPTRRALDPDTVPPDIRARLVEVPVLIVAATGVDAVGGYLAIVTDLGVAHVAEFAGGSHPVNVFVESGAEWRIVAYGNGRSLEDGEVIAKFVPTDVIRLGSGGVTVDLYLDATSGDPSALVKLLENEDFQARLAEWLLHQAETGD